MLSYFSIGEAAIYRGDDGNLYFLADYGSPFDCSWHLPLDNYSVYSVDGEKAWSL